MLTHPTIEQLQALHLTAMAQAFEQQRGSSQHAALSFEDRFGLLVDTEWTAREQRRLAQRLRHAKLRYPACLEDVDFATPRGLVREVVLSLGTGGWLRDHHNVLITGPTGIGKSWLACAFVQNACRQGFSATYVRMPRLLHELAVSRGDGSYARLLARLAKLDLLAIDDWLLAALTDGERRDLLEVIEDRSERASTLIASQLPPTAWHAAIGEPSVADAICDRLVHRAHRLTLKGPTMRDPDTKRGKAKS
jgi:DNA replication protein DnaC